LCFGCLGFGRGFGFVLGLAFGFAFTSSYAAVGVKKLAVAVGQTPCVRASSAANAAADCLCTDPR